MNVFEAFGQQFDWLLLFSHSDFNSPSASTCTNYYNKHQHTCTCIIGGINNVFVICSVQLTLDEQYDVTWHIPDGKRNNPLFSTNAFDLDEEELELMGSVDGSSYVFEV